ncbi:MAG: bifunctional phosphopantothenoylcysteine decarboxylase/phosphopantothenate--cysteine ligase CoaBC [Nitrospinales bacterium]
MPSVLRDKVIALGVSGGIAAYKAVELARLLVRAGASVYVVLSANAGRFVTPLTFRAVSGHPVYHDVFEPDASDAMEHVQTAANADLLIVAPASANAIAKMANGLADDALSTLFAAYDGPVIVAPSMNDKMYANPAVRENIEKLQMHGIEVLDPDRGELACGTVGLGRLPEPTALLKAVKRRMSTADSPERKKDLAGMTFLVTAGPTREPLDPVRYLTNASSGKMGYAVAERARARGAKVILISGPTRLDPPHGVTALSCLRAHEMASLVRDHFPQCDVLVMAAAVGDFAPETVQDEKIKKGSQDSLTIKFCRNPDILLEASKHKTRQIMVGFAAETQDVVQHALSKLQQKHLDLIVANDVGIAGNGFQSDFNQVTLIESETRIEELPRLPKQEVADILLDRVLELAAERKQRAGGSA